jgi:hypothetical protein
MEGRIDRDKKIKKEVERVREKVINEE